MNGIKMHEPCARKCNDDDDFYFNFLSISFFFSFSFTNHTQKLQSLYKILQIIKQKKKKY